MAICFIANKSFIKKIPNLVKDVSAPLTKLDLNLLEGIQKEIPLFKNNSMSEIAFITKNLETLNFFRGCAVGCSHCLKNAKSFDKNKRSILFEDIIRFANGFKNLNERLGINVFNGINYLNITDDANPSDFPIKGLNREHTVTEGIKILFESLKIPLLYVTSGWNKDSKTAQKSAEELAKMAIKNPESTKIEISINPFSKIMDLSREALKNNNQIKAEYYRKLYISRMANTIATFFPLIKLKKADIIYRHASDYKGNELVNAKATAELYKDIYNELGSIIGSDLELVPQLYPDIITKEAPAHFIEPSGRARAYFPFDVNMKVQEGLIQEALDWNRLTSEEKADFLKNNSLKCIDINGNIYTSRPATKTFCINSPLEITTPTNIKLNFIRNNLETKNVFSDIELEY